MSQQKNLAKGVVLVEVLLAAGILGLLLTPILNLLVTSLESNWFASQEIKAQAYLLRQMEGLRSIRARNWEELVPGDYYVDEVDDRWELVPGEDGLTEDEFTTFVEIEPVYRDDTDAIVAETDPGARLDPSTSKVLITVSWQLLRARQMSMETYLTRYLDNESWEQTTVADFETGEMDYTKTVSPVQDDGEIQLEGGCFSETPEALIYDDAFRNGWRVNCDGLTFFKKLICLLLQFFNSASFNPSSTGQTWNSSSFSIKLDLTAPGSGSFWSWGRVYNYDAVCTKGFKNLHFYAYNNATEEVSFNVTAVYGHWDNTVVTLPPQEWTEVSLDYETVNEDFNSSLGSIYFSKWMTAGEPAVTIYLDQIELTGGVGGYFTDGTLVSSVFDATKEGVFNRISWEASTPAQTEVGFQVATSDNAIGPWVYYGPGGTSSTSDLYTTAAGEGIWLGNNYGRWLRYQAFLHSSDGVSTPILESVTINYSP